MLEIRTRIGKLFDQLSYRKTEQTIDAFRPYRELLESVATQRELDIDEIEIILEAAGKDRFSFDKDIETFIQRCEWSSQLRERDQAASDVPQLTNVVNSLAAEHDAFVAKWRPKMQAARSQLDDANSTMLKTSGVEAYLVGSVLDPSIAIRQRELTAKKQELLAERSVAVVATKGPAYQVHCATIARDNASNSMRLFGIDLSTGPFAAGKNKEELQRANAVLAEQKPLLDAANDALAEVDAKLRSLDVEQKELDRLKLVP